MFVFVNAAMSADGKIATIERKQIKLSGKDDLDRRDELRASSDAIIVGIGTILSDNPSLTVKSEKRRRERMEKGKDENPIRVVVDSKARTPTDSDLLKKGAGRRMIVVSKGAPKERVEALRGKAEIIVAGEEEIDLKKMLDEFKKEGIERVMVEGGATLNWAFISEKLVDEIYVYVGNMIIGGATAPSIVDGEGFIEEEMPKLILIDAHRMDGGLLLRWKVKKG
jgi:2,5-diamino-6-(ribosylamino)-4(3H)-pyrimidinone 5'-phosphate reductase